MARSFKRPDEAAMQRVFARTSGGAAEVVLRLAWLQGLHRAEITALRWDQVDFAGRALLLPDRTVPLDPSVEACLRAWYVRCGGKSECVAVSDRDQTPMRPESVSRLARQALNSEGLALSLLDLRRDFILRQIEAHGWSHAAQVSGAAAAPAAAGSGGTGARGRAVLPCGRGDAAGGAAGCDPNVSAGTRQWPPSGFSQAAECFPGTGDADPAAADGAGGADSHGAALHAAKREIAGYDCRNY